MARWEPNARERLMEAAMALFQERGYDQTTVEDIAARAGLTERTFFRYFSDKREVLFSGASQLSELVLGAIDAAAESMAPLEVVVAAFQASSEMFEQRRAFARRRQALIARHAELQERELIKLSTMAVQISAALRRRGVAKASADLIAETGVTIFKNAFERWVNGDKKRDLAHHLGAAMNELRAATGETPVRRSAPLNPRSGRPYRSPG
ncbi:MAG: TetR family transcriptional regulator [Myxococcota bacterium]